MARIQINLEISLTKYQLKSLINFAQIEIQKERGKLKENLG